MTATPVGQTVGSPMPHYWNVFAGVLQYMLEARQPPLRLGHLDNRPDPLGKTIHSQKVSRLQQSLRRPMFPTLNPDEIEQVAQVFGFTLDQKIRLTAAVLATAVQAILAGRIGAQDACLAGWQVLPLIETSLRAHWDEEGLGSARVDPEADPASSEENEEAEEELDAFSAHYSVALAAIDQGVLDLALAEHATTQRERRANARAAQDAFASALALLEQAPFDDAANGEAADFWKEQARQGERAAEKL